MVIMKDLLRVQYDTYEYKSFRVITPAHVFICYCNNEIQICTICCLKRPQALHSTQVSLNSSLVSLTVSIYDGGCSCLACLACFVHASHVCLACLACLAGSHIVHIPRLTTYPVNTLKSSSKKDDSNSPCLRPFYSNLDYIFLGSIRRQQESL